MFFFTFGSDDTYKFLKLVSYEQGEKSSPAYLELST